MTVQKVQRRAFTAPRHSVNPSASGDSGTERLCDRLEITGASSRNRLPLELLGHGQEVVVVEEAHQHSRREFPRRRRSARPHRRSHWEQIKLAELGGVSLFIQKLA